MHYKFLRMQFGSLSAAEVFQKKMIEAFEDIVGVQIIYDDILITGKTVEEHGETLRKVLQFAREGRMKFNKKKMKSRITEVKYFRSVFTEDGLKPCHTVMFSRVLCCLFLSFVWYNTLSSCIVICCKPIMLWLL